MYASATQDCANKFAVARHVYGFPFTQPFPDLDHVECLFIIGANPVVSKWSFLQVSNPIERLREIEGRGGKVFFVDPRKTESAKVAGEHVFIRPNTDVFFYLSFLNEVIAQGGVKRERVERFIEFSTSEVYGPFIHKGKEDDLTTIGPVGENRWVYAASKLASEHLSFAHHKEDGLPLAIVRPFNVYGPRQVGDGAIRGMVLQALQHRHRVVAGTWLAGHRTGRARARHQPRLLADLAAVAGGRHAARAPDQRPQIDVGHHAVRHQHAVGLVIGLLHQDREFFVQHRLQVAQVGAQFVVVGDQVAGDEEFFAALVRLGDALRNLFEAEFVVARAQGIARLAGVDGVGAKVVGGAHAVQRAGGQEQFGGFHQGVDCPASTGCVLAGYPRAPHRHSP